MFAFTSTNDSTASSAPGETKPTATSSPSYVPVVITAIVLLAIYGIGLGIHLTKPFQIGSLGPSNVVFSAKALYVMIKSGPGWIILGLVTLIALGSVSINVLVKDPVKQSTYQTAINGVVTVISVVIALLGIMFMGEGVVLSMQKYWTELDPATKKEVAQAAESAMNLGRTINFAATAPAAVAPIATTTPAAGSFRASSRAPLGLGSSMKSTPSMASSRIRDPVTSFESIYD